jgi:hypothetical protein
VGDPFKIKLKGAMVCGVYSRRNRADQIENKKTKIGCPPSAALHRCAMQCGLFLANIDKGKQNGELENKNLSQVPRMDNDKTPCWLVCAWRSFDSARKLAALKMTGIEKKTKRESRIKEKLEGGIRHAAPLRDAQGICFCFSFTHAGWPCRLKCNETTKEHQSRGIQSAGLQDTKMAGNK